MFLAINIVVYLAWAGAVYFQSYVGFEFLVANFLISWNSFLDGRYWTLLTPVFSHEGFFHLFINMMVLKSFGPIMQVTLGTRRFVIFYLTAGIFSSLSHALVSAYIVGDASVPALGASGALAGVVLLFSLVFPQEKLLFLGIIPVRAIWGALLFIGIDIWGVIAQSKGGGFNIGHGAHLGGAFVGIIYYLLLRSASKSLGRQNSQALI